MKRTMQGTGTTGLCPFWGDATLSETVTPRKRRLPSWNKCRRSGAMLECRREPLCDNLAVMAIGPCAAYARVCLRRHVYLPVPCGPAAGRQRVALPATDTAFQRRAEAAGRCHRTSRAARRAGSHAVPGAYSRRMRDLRRVPQWSSSDTGIGKLAAVVPRSAPALYYDNCSLFGAHPTYTRTPPPPEPCLIRSADPVPCRYARAPFQASRQARVPNVRAGLNN